MHSASTGQHRACERVLTRVACLHVLTRVCSLALSHDCGAHKRPTCWIWPRLCARFCFPATRRPTNDDEHPGPTTLNLLNTVTGGGVRVGMLGICKGIC